MSGVVQKAYSLKIASAESVADRGQFVGTALVYNEQDSSGDLIREGCFRKSIHDAGGRFPCLWSHDPREVLGSITVQEDARTLSVTGSLLTDVIAKAREVHALLKARALKGLSVGFVPLRAGPIDGGGTEFIEGRLLEVSLTSVPAYASASVTEVRSVSDLVRSLNQNHDREALVALRRSIDEILACRDPAPTEELAAVFAQFDPAKWRR